MKLCDLYKKEASAHLERYVNNGSPSGYSIKCSTSKNTNPFTGSEYIHPYICISNKSNFIDFGAIPNIDVECSNSENWVLVHPDMSEHAFFKNENLKLKRADSIKLVPTASARTLQLVDSDFQGYFKLHYDGTIGRLERKLPYDVAISGVEISKILESLIDDKKLDERLTHLPEIGARILRIQNQDWGMVWRSKMPYGDCSKIKYVIPVFALFSKDRHNPKDNTLLEQIITEKFYDPTTYVVDYLINPIIECYFSLLKNAGIQGEWHAQNLLIGFDEDFLPQKIIARDLESMDKDMTLIEIFNLPFQFQSNPYKCIDKSREDYQKKHSFMFDFKLGEYVIQPLINFLESIYFIGSDTLIPSIKECSENQIKELPEDFFPNQWYGYKNVEINRTTDERPYLMFDNPKFRP
ncbi:MAG: ferric iron reductase [Bacteroidales bacterium]|jgi:hypothetical protein|nr:ferric iron reductase [Bacteroidales bacterium]